MLAPPDRSRPSAGHFLMESLAGTRCRRCSLPEMPDDLRAMIQDVFVPGVPVVEKMLRPIVVYAFMVLLLRLAGHRALSSMNAFDLVVLLLLSNTVQNAIIGNDNSVAGGLVGAVTLVTVNW